jgi:uncharacterized protein (TIGR02246 family)
MPRDDDTQAILDLLDRQAAAWNDGDLAAFMQPYWRSPRLRYANGGDVLRGWDALLAGYRERYRDRAQMGTARFTDVEVELLSDDAAVVFGRYALERADGCPHGTYTLVLRKLPEGWRIVSDHTSAAA